MKLIDCIAERKLASIKGIAVNYAIFESDESSEFALVTYADMDSAVVSFVTFSHYISALAKALSEIAEDTL